MKSSGTTNSGIKQVGVSVQTEYRRSVHAHLLPVVIIARDTPDLARLMGAYIGRARLALLPDWASATKLIKSLRANHIGILAVLGFPDNPGSIPLSAKHANSNADATSAPSNASDMSPRTSATDMRRNVLAPSETVA